MAPAAPGLGVPLMGHRQPRPPWQTGIPRGEPRAPVSTPKAITVLTAQRFTLDNAGPSPWPTDHDLAPRPVPKGRHLLMNKVFRNEHFSKYCALLHKANVQYLLFRSASVLILHNGSTVYFI